MQRSARLARSLLDCGLIPYGLQTPSVELLPQLCEYALQAWLDATAGHLSVLDVGLVAEVEREQIVISAGPAQARELICGPVLERLHALDARLPASVLTRLERVSWKAVPLISCHDQFDIASYTQWGGCQDAEEHADEMDLSGEDREQYFEQAITRAQILERTPAWALQPPEEGYLGNDELRAFGAATADPLAAQIIAALLALEAAPAPHHLVHGQAREEGGECVGYGALLRFGEEDWVLPLAEQVVNSAFEAGTGYDDTVRAALGLDDANGLRTFLDDLSPWLRLTQQFDHLLFLLSGAQSDCEPKEKS
ncbi:MAG TPA: hypothetical protein PKV98_13635 [Burkholderiaceae bacterium]|nr:hypothetical protein [Burkholderiaceae bacterium]